VLFGIRNQGTNYLGQGWSHAEEWGNWSDGAIAQILDFDPDEDEIVVVYDPAQSADPILSLQQGANFGEVTVLLDGVPLAHLANAETLDLADIRLVAETPVR
jgi:hypothetical protein